MKYKCKVLLKYNNKKYVCFYCRFFFNFEEIKIFWKDSIEK